MLPPKKLLAIKLRALGDTVLLTAPLATIKKAWPETEIHVVTVSDSACLLENHPAISKIWKHKGLNHRVSHIKESIQLALKLRSEHFDCVVNFHASSSSGMIAFATGAKHRSVHFHGLKDKNLYSTFYIPGKGIVKPILERDMDTIRALGIQSSTQMPKIFLIPSELQQATQWLETMNPKAFQSHQRSLLILGMGASRPSKSWSIKRYAELAYSWGTTQANGLVLATAGPSEGAILSQFIEALNDQIEKHIQPPLIRSQIRARIFAENQLSLRFFAALTT